LALQRKQILESLLYRPILLKEDVIETNLVTINNVN